MRSGIKFGISTLLLMALISVIGCGGSGKPAQPVSTSFTISGSVTGFSGTGLVLQNNGGNDLTVSANATSFNFAAPVASGGVYSVTVFTQPAGENCTVSNGSGTATANVTSVKVTCNGLYTIGGTIAGLNGPGLVLQDNGGDDLAVNANASSFTFATPLASGSAYKIAVLTQPVGESCAVTNGTGTASANVTDPSVVCTQLYAVGGTVTGLNGTGLVLQDNGGDNLTVAAKASNFTFATPLAGGSAYSITVMTQPAGENCTVSNGSGTIASGVGNTSVVCVGEWAWMGGSGTVGLGGGQPGVYGVLGSSSPRNIPGGRAQSVTWKDASGSAWLFGGQGYDSAGTYGLLNDLWKFDPAKGTSGEWTWMGGSAVATIPISSAIPMGQPGSYGKQGVASPTNFPGARTQAVSWTDQSGNLWLLGGIGIDSIGEYGFLNDLWEFNPKLGANGEWTWMAGDSTVPIPDLAVFHLFGKPGVYGTQGTPADNNKPGGRYGAYAWTDQSGNLWLFGGNGFDAAGSNADLNDLWEFNPHLGLYGQWTWMGGNSTVSGGGGGGQGAPKGVYKGLGTADPDNIPGGRYSGTAWTDAAGNFWLFGGLGADSAGSNGFLNDLWMFDPKKGTSGEWAWMGGSNTIGSAGGQPGTYGVQGVPSPTNTPGARFGSPNWVDASGNLWLFGGQGYDWVGDSGYLNDLWEYTPAADGGIGQWTWMGGSSTIPLTTDPSVQSGHAGVYGTLGTPDVTNNPGTRVGAAPWIDASGNLWLFGGQGYDSNGALGYLNDAWMYQP